MIKIKTLNKKEDGKNILLEEMRLEVLEKENTSRQISLMASEIMPGLREVPGLCTKRFYADIETESLDYASLSVGDILEFNDVRLQITGKGKRCFDECPIRRQGRVCPLPTNVAFARVIQGGTLKVHAAGAEAFKI